VWGVCVCVVCVCVCGVCVCVVPIKIFGSKRDSGTAEQRNSGTAEQCAGGGCITRSFVICTVSDQIRSDQI